MKYLYKNKIIDEMKVRKILLEKGIEDIRSNIGDYVMRNVNFDESDVNIAINGNMEEVIRYLKDYDIEIKTATINKYEGVVLLNIRTTLIQLKNVKDRIEEIVYNLMLVEDLGIKKLAYDIKENKEAYYIRFEFTDKAENIAELEKYFRINDDILKFIIIKRED